MSAGIGWVSAEVSPAGPPVEVRRAVRLTVRLGEPAGRTGGGEAAVGNWGGVAAGAGGEAAGAESISIRPARVVGAGREGMDEGSRVLGGEAETEGVEAEEWGDSPALARDDVARSDLRTSKRIVISLETGVLYDDNIFLNGLNPVADTLWRASGEVRLNYGDAVRREDNHLVVRYRPDAYFFQDNTDENSVDHEAAVSVRRRFGRTTVEGTGLYQRTSGSTVELGNRVPRDVVVARAAVVREVGAKTSLGTALRWDSTAYRESGYADYREWANESFVDYQATGKFRFGLGGTFGRLEVDDGSAPQDFQRALLRTTYTATGKLEVLGKAGVEFRQTEVGESTTPVFGVDLRHDLTGKTSARLQAQREVAASGSQEGRNYIRSGLSAGLTHRFNDRLSFLLDGGWEQYDYEAAAKSAEGLADRSDHNVFVRPGFSYAFGDRWKAEAWYQWRSADSSDPTQVYDVNQAGLNLRCDF